MPRTASSPTTLAEISRALSRRLQSHRFSPPTDRVYNPLEYAQGLHEAYLERFGPGTGRILLLGMNPGPWGMAQTGVPFGDVGFVRDWMGLRGAVKKPRDEHPKRPVQGLACTRREGSGSRLWGWARDRFQTPEAFFERFFVINYCPLIFLEESGRNRTPDKLPRDEQGPLQAECDRALRETVALLRPSLLLGVGVFAEKRAREALQDLTDPGVRVERILHPSPASPAANRGWVEEVERQLGELGVL